MFPRLKNYLEDRIVQQNGAPRYYAVAVRQWINQQLQNYWLERVDPIPGPSRSPDLTLCDYIYGDIWKSLCSVSPVQP